jgi:hypothetical protein
MATATAKKPAAAPALPVTFDEIAQGRMRSRVEAYRALVTRHANGGQLTVDDMEKLATLLDDLGLPQWVFERDVAAIQKHRVAAEKYRAAVEAVPGFAKRAEELAVEIEKARQHIDALREEHRVSLARTAKPAAYGNTLTQLAHEHPHLFAEIDVAVRFRIEELDRRKAGGVE